MSRLTLPRWLRRALEAGLGAGAVAVASLLGTGMSSGGGAFALPPGGPGAVLLAPAVLALAVVTTAYPIALAATREDALLGAIAALLIATDLTVVLGGGPIFLERRGLTLPGGVLVAAVAAGPAAVGLVASQLGAPLGFGRRAAGLCALAATIAAVVALGVVALLA